MDEFKYVIWSVNRWNDNLLQEQVAIFKSLDLALNFVEYQAAVNSDSYIVTLDGVRVN